MKGLDKQVRLIIEGNFDEILKDSKSYEKVYSDMLRSIGIESNLERLVSFFSGFILGTTQQLYRRKYGRGLNSEEINELIELMKRRAFEVRMAFMSTRVNE